MKSYVFPLLAGLLFLLPACKNDDETPGSCSVPPPSSLDYIPLQVGNHWVYDWYSMNSQNDDGEYRFTDTLSVNGLETINGKEYFYLTRTENNILRSNDIYLRDSLGFLINEKGEVDFTLENRGSIFNSVNFGTPDTILFIMEQTILEDWVEVEVPVGKFLCLDKASEVKKSGPDEPTRKTFHDFIVPGLGDIKGDIGFFNGNSFFQYRLVDYKLN